MSAGLLVAGTTSDAGKSIVTTALCRAFARRGVQVAPFKAQNMSNNSMVTGDGAEVGRAQWVQALAARAVPEAAMNPVLLKPGSDQRCHVVVMGRPSGELRAGEFATGRAALAEAAFSAYDDLASRYDVVVCEGAGSPAETNLRAGDFVNLGLARHADLPVVVVGDIDRGGVLAAMFGTLALLDADDQALVAGFVVNKFRGDRTLLQPGLDTLTSLTGRPVHGVLPWHEALWLDSEDTLAVPDGQPQAGATQLRVAVVRLPRVSNFTDVDALRCEPGVDVRFVHRAQDLREADVVVLPGTRATLADLRWLRERGLADAVVAHAGAGRAVLGVCGGYQLLGGRVTDRDGVEAEPGTTAHGLGLLDVTTMFTRDKVLTLRSGELFGAAATGYEVHHGQVQVGSGEPFPGGVVDGPVAGTLWHGLLESDAARAAWLGWAASLCGRPGLPASGVSFADLRERRLDLLGDLAEQHLDVDALLDLALRGVPAGLSVLRGGLA